MKTIKLLVIPIILLIALQNPAVPQDYSTQVNNINDFITEAFNKFKPVGLSIAIVKNDKIIYSKALGYKNIETKEKLNTGSLFNIASCSKAFTAAAVGMLVEEGKLHWEDKVIDYIPTFRLADPYITRELNIEDILCHRSGLGTFYGDLLWYNTDYTNEEIIHRMRYLPITNYYRAEYGYQNNMFMIAGEILKKISNKTWSEFIKERIFDPLEMHTSRPSFDELDNSQDIAYPHINGKLQPLYDWNGSKAAGAIYSNVEELAHWVAMLLNEGKWNDQSILQPRTIRTLFASHTILGVNPTMNDWGIHFRSYGLGWFSFDYGGKKILEHGGGMPGYISKVVLVPEEKLGFIVLNNGMESFINNAIRYQILDEFINANDIDWTGQFLQFKNSSEQNQKKRDKIRISTRKTGTKPSLELIEYCGTYTDKMYGDAEITTDNSKLLLTLLPAKQIFTSEMVHWHYDTFKVQFKDDFLPFGLITFEFNSSGQVTGFTIDLPNDDFHFFNLHFVK